MANRITDAFGPSWLYATVAGRAKLAESNRLWRRAQDRFEAVYGAERAAALRIALAEIYSDAFAEAFSMEKSRNS